ncbi:hypothetical protein [Sphingomonas sp. PAMC 26621]|uniref:hypothetical protein n=1 Tax=Sphingomonas sp. PAMC 26621 TaxID=1112213 RepID=UPI000289875C|nr:hypothetical protein [Sphingomonas sp. PAMC 26621]
MSMSASLSDARPRYADEHDTLASLAAHLLGERVARYPAAVAAAKLTQADADTGIRIMSAIAARWRAIADRQPLPPTCACCGGASLHEQRDTLAAAAARTSQIAAKDRGNANKADYAAAATTLLWHAEHALAAEANCRNGYAEAA